MSEPLRLAVSNIAWIPDEDDAVAELLRREKVGGVEIAPTKWRDRPLNASARDVAAYRRAWEDRGLRIVSLQSLLYGRPDLQLFADETRRASTIDYLRRIIDLGSALGAHALVFGSPKNRVRGTLSEREATPIAVDAFRELGVHAQSLDMAFCIEANPPAYGCDFITTTAQAVALCKAIDHPGVRVNADLGGMAMLRESPIVEFSNGAGWIGHVHASEPQLSELTAASGHDGAAAALLETGYSAWISIEMRAMMPFASESNLAAIGRAVNVAKTAYAAVIE